MTPNARGPKQIVFDRTYDAPVETVWQAWTEADRLRQWWGPEKTTVPECEVDLVVGGRFYIVMAAGAEMGRYAGTRWPMEAVFTRIEAPTALAYDARSWTEGHKTTETISHTNELVLSADGDRTRLQLRIAISSVGSGLKARLYSYGMKWGYKSQLDRLAGLFAREGSSR